MTPAVQNVVLNAPFNPYRLGNNAAAYSLEGVASNATYLTGASGLYYVADRSGNSAVNGLVLPGVASNSATVPDSAASSPTTAIDLIIRCAMSDWTPAAAESLAGKWNAGGNQRSYSFNVAIGGTMTFVRSTDGTSGTLATATSSAANTITDYAQAWVRVTYDAASGDTKFYTSADSESVPSVWTQLGTTQTITAGNIFDGTDTAGVGKGNTSGGNGLMVRRWIVRNSIDGAAAIDADFTTVAKLATSFTESSSNAATVTINATAIALPARIHGARDLYQHLTASMPTYLAYSGTKFGYLNGVTGNYFSTLDSAALDITGDIDLRCEAELISWSTPAATAGLVAKRNQAAQKSYTFGISITTGLLFARFSSSDADVAGELAISSVAAPFAANTRGWVRVTRSGTAVIFYTSTDGTTWTPLGTAQVINNISMQVTTSPLGVGAYGDGNLALNGKVYRAQVYNGVAGTLVADFNPTLFVSGTTFTAATNEEWTRNAGAYIGNGGEAYLDGTADYLKSAPFSLSQPNSGYHTASAVSWTSGDYVLDGGGTNGGAIIQTTSTPQINLNAGSSVAGNTGWTLGVRAVLSAFFNGASSALGVNTNAQTTGNAGAGTANGVTIGARGAGDLNWGNITWSQSLYRSVADDSALSTRIIRFFMRLGGISG